MPRVICPKCKNATNVYKAGLIRNKQRYYCKNCNYHFIEKRKDTPAEASASPITIKALSKIVGYSTSTISRALNDYKEISTKTKSAIIKAARKYNYTPNEVASGLAKSSIKTIGVIIPHLSTAFFSSMLSTIQKELFIKGYNTIIFFSNEDPESEENYINILIKHRVDGILWCRTNNYKKKILSLLTNYKKPTVLFYRGIGGQNRFSQIISDDYNAGLKLTELLIEKGYKQIAILLDKQCNANSEMRLKGFKDAFKKKNIKLNPHYILHSDLTEAHIEVLLKELFKRKTVPDAIICVSEMAAIYVLQLFKNSRIKIPAQLGLITIGNDGIGKYVVPSLTEWQLNTEEIAKKATDKLLDEIHHDAPSSTFIVSGNLIIRDSLKL